MCIVCVELIRQKMTLVEAERNLGELINDKRETIEQQQHKLRLKEAIDLGDVDYLAEELEKGVVDEIGYG